MACVSTATRSEHSNTLIVQPRCSRSLQISSLDSKEAPGPCDTCTVPRLCTSSAAFLCSPVSAGPPSSAPSPSRHWRTDHAAHLEENDRKSQKKVPVKCVPSFNLLYSSKRGSYNMHLPCVKK